MVQTTTIKVKVRVALTTDVDSSRCSAKRFVRLRVHRLVCGDQRRVLPRACGHPRSEHAARGPLGAHSCAVARGSAEPTSPWVHRVFDAGVPKRKPCCLGKLLLQWDNCGLRSLRGALRRLVLGAQCGVLGLGVVAFTIRQLRLLRQSVVLREDTLLVGEQHCQELRRASGKLKHRRSVT